MVKRKKIVFNAIWGHDLSNGNANAWSLNDEGNGKLQNADMRNILSMNQTRP